jgi:hypothetical protein
MLNLLWQYRELVLGVVIGVVLGGFFPPYAIAAAKWVAAQISKIKL